MSFEYQVMQNRIRSIDIEPLNKEFSYILINGTPAGRYPHKQAEELRAKWIDELAKELED